MSSPLKPMEWDESKSRLTDEVRAAWHKRKLTGDLKTDKVPGVGDVTIKALEKIGIHNTFQLIGDMLKFVEGPITSTAELRKLGNNYFGRLVSDFKSPKASSHTTVDALMSKAAYGFHLPPISIPPSKMADDMWSATRGMKNSDGQYVLSGKLVEDFHFIGDKIAESLAKDKADPLLNSWQLVGLFLSFYTLGKTDGAVESFKKRLGTYGPGIQSSAIAAQIVEILGSGMALVPRKK